MADATVDLATVWDSIRERLATSLTRQQNAMLNLTRPLGLVEDTAVLAAPNEFTQTVLESRMRRVLAEALSEQLGRDIRVAVQLEDGPADVAAAGREEPPPTRRPWTPAAGDRPTDEDRERTDDGRSAFGVRSDARPLDRSFDGAGYEPAPSYDRPYDPPAYDAPAASAGAGETAERPGPTSGAPPTGAPPAATAAAAADAGRDRGRAPRSCPSTSVTTSLLGRPRTPTARRGGAPGAAAGVRCRCSATAVRPPAWTPA